MDIANSIDMVLLFKYVISTNFNNIVDCIIGAPEHREVVVDGINSCDKRYFMGKCV